jgi:hypothetical protein
MRYSEEYKKEENKGKVNITDDTKKNIHNYMVALNL